MRTHQKSLSNQSYTRLNNPAMLADVLCDRGGMGRIFRGRGSGFRGEKGFEVAFWGGE